TGVYYDTLATQHGCDSIVRYIFNEHNTFEYYQTISICIGESFDFFGQKISNAGDYSKTFKTAYGCDSVYHLHLTVNPTYLFVTDTVVCGNTFRFRNREYTASGTYYDSLKTATGCDSVYQLNLRLYSKNIIDKTLDVCEGDSVYIRGKLVPATGVYYDTLKTHYGCDSIVRYIFNVHTSFDIHDTVSICQGDYYDFNGRRLTESGDYLLNYKTIKGCDSTIHLNLIVNPSYFFQIDTTLIADHFFFNNRIYTQSGIYYDTLSTKNGCDSVYELKLHLHPVSPITDVNVSVCQGDSFVIRGKLVPAKGIYYDTLLNVYGSDSIIRYIFNVHTIYNVYDTATICQGDYYDFNGRRITTPGDYLLNYKTIEGCDSIIHLNLSVNPSYFFQIDTTLIADHFFFNDRKYTKSGTYYDTLSTVNGCDSIYELKLHLRPISPITDVNISVCQGDSFMIRGKLVPAIGIYYDTMLNVYGSDSVIRYIFNVHTIYNVYDTATICQGEYYDFNGRRLTESGDYSLNYKTIEGCDSILHLHLKINPSYFFQVDTTVVADYFIFNSIVYTSSGTYYDTLSTVNGCDSVYELKLHLHPVSPISDINISVCQGDSFYIRGKLVPAKGIYYDTLLNIYGSDSIIRYIFNVHTSYDIYDTASVCQGEYYDFNGRKLTVSGDYSLNYKTIEGCDSILHLHLTVNPSYLFQIDTTLCADYFVFNGRTYTKSGIYYDSMSTVNGCDSVYKLNLTLNHSSSGGDVYLKMCEGDSCVIGGKIIRHSTIFIDTLLNSHGCDSTIRYIITFAPSFHFYDTVSICNSDSYIFQGETITSPGDYVKKYETIGGCDSVYHLHLVTYPKYLFTIDTIVCGHSFRFHGRDYTKSGTYYDSLRTIHGCDSIYVLNLSLHPEVVTELNIDVCEGDSVYIRGKNVPAMGIYYDTLKTHYGCDSIVRFVFNVHSTFNFYESASICPGDIYYFQGKPINEAGDYVKTFKTAFGCDSVYHLHLEINPSYLFVIDTIACGHTFRFHNREYTASGTYFDSLHTQIGCDSVYQLNLLLYPEVMTDIHFDVCEGDSVYIRGKNVPAMGIYYDTLKTRYGCDSIVRYIFNVHGTFEISEVASICANDTFDFHGTLLTNGGDYTKVFKTESGCDSIYHLHLDVLPSYLYIVDTIACGGSFHFHNKYYTESGTYYDSLRTVSGCDSIYQLNLKLYLPTMIDINLDVCEGDSMYIGGKKIHATGVYYDTLLTSEGCYDIHRYIFNVNKTYEFHKNVAICPGDVYNFYGRNITTGGVYSETFKSVKGCDSTYYIHVSVNPSYLIVVDTTVCAYSFNLNGKEYTSSGVYFDQYYTINGCDSVYKLILSLTEPQINEIYLDVCDGESVTIRDTVISASGVYNDSIFFPNGCYAIDRYVFNIHPKIEIFDTINICQGEYYPFFGSLISLSGDYVNYGKTIYGCDSICHLHLIVHPNHYIEVDTTICEDQPFFVNGIQIRTSGVYYHNFKTKYGCDSTIAYNLTVRDTTHVEYYDTICDNESYMFAGKKYNVTGVYRDTVKSQYGCDIINTLFLTVNPTYNIDRQMTVCANELPFIWEGQTVNAGGKYTAKYTSVSGCDSVINLDLTVNRTPITFDTVYNCSGGNYHWHDMLITLPGDYAVNLRTDEGCDALALLHYDTVPMVRVTRATICNGDGYLFRGTTYYHDGIYDIHAPSSSINCDTIYRLILHVDTTPIFTDTTLVLCNVTGYMFAGKLLTKSGIYFDTVMTAGGCYHITKLNLTIGTDVLVERQFEICYGSSITFRGTTYSTSGVFYDSLISSSGCDSVYKIVVNVLPTFVIDYDTLYVCGVNDSVSFNNRWYKAGIYYFVDSTSTDPCPTRYRLVVKDESYRFDTIVSICASEVPFVHPATGKRYYYTGSYDDIYSTVKYGCDSVYHLDLTVLPEPRHDTFDTICQGDLYYFNGVYYKSDTLVIDTLIATNFCDSIDVLHLKMIVNRDTTIAVICQGDNYVWPVNNNIYTTSGYYHYTDSFSSLPCPIHHVLSLTVVPPIVVDGLDIAYACADDSLFNVNANIAPGSTPRTINVYFDQAAHDAGFVDMVDTFVGRSFTLPMPTIYNRNNDPLYYITPGLYNVRIQFDNGVCNPQFSEATAVLEVRYPSFILEQNWNDVVAVTRYNHHDKNGNDISYTFSRFEWFVDGSPIAGASKSYLYNEGLSLVGHVVYARLTRTGENTGVFTCPITVTQMQESGEYPVVNGPANMLRQNSPMTSFSATEGGHYTIYSISGHAISSGSFEADTDVNIYLPSVAGCYILHVQTEHLFENYKIIVY
ncbi:MAG: hypothetical protein KBT40_05640, partial [bacterium]|nr:hypothetical protein [Candidatus Minthenecus merdequi]